MLSAFAARKARLSNTPVVQTPTAPSLSPSPPSPSPNPPSAAKNEHRSSRDPPSKRKPEQASNARKSKKKKVRHPRVGKQTQRYFEDGIGKGEDVVMVGQDESDESNDDTEGEHDGDASVAPVVPVSAKKKEKRVWSPSRPLPDSSEESHCEGDEQDVEEADIPVPVPPKQQPPETLVLSTFHPAPGQNMFKVTPDELSSMGLSGSDEDAVMLVVSPDETLALVGTYILSVVRGTISLLGVTLHASHVAHRVFAPRSSPIPVLQCYTSETPHALFVLPERIQAALTHRDQAVISLQRLATGVEGLGRVCKVFDSVFQPTRWQSRSAISLDVPGVHILTHASKEVHPFVLPASWDSALSALSSSSYDTNLSPLICLVKGPKKSGKSTFARTLLNRLLSSYQKVAFLECDLGQSEFTPGGMVALNIIQKPVFGPPFTHPTLPYLAHYIGTTSPRSSPSHYLASIQALVASYQLDVQFPLPDTDAMDEDDERITDVIPLIVNTMGWNKGLGADLNAKIDEMVGATWVFEVESTFEGGWAGAANEGMQQQQQQMVEGAGGAKKHYILEPIPSSPSAQYNAIDQRNISILSYFHAIFPSPSSSLSTPLLTQVSATSWITTLPLCAQYPYEVDWSVALDKVVLTGADAEDVVPTEIDTVMNGAVVGFVRCDPDALTPSTPPHPSSTPTMPYTQSDPAPPPSTSSCIGLALIRGVAPTSPHLHVLTPLPPAYLGDARVLIKGELELPVWGMLDFREEGGGVANVERGRVPYLQWGKGEGVGAERRRVRRNLMRKGQT